MPAPLRKIAPLDVRVQTAPVLSIICVAGGVRVLFEDSVCPVGGGAVAAPPDAARIVVSFLRKPGEVKRYIDGERTI